MSMLTAFNTQLMNLINDLSNIYPEDKELMVAKTSIELLRKANPRKVLEGFANFIFPYRTQINTRDESFFVTHDFTELASEYNGESNFNMIRAKFVQYWQELSVHNKETIWTYFQVLLKIADKCIIPPSPSAYIST